MWKKILLIIVLSFGLCSDSYAVKPKRDAAKIRKEQQATKKQIKETTQKININTRETKKQLSRLNSLNGEIEVKGAEINKMKIGVDSINRRLTTINDSINALNSHLASLRDSYVKSLRKMQGTSGAMGSLAFIFSSESFSEAYRKLRYMQQFDKWRKRKAQDIKVTEDLLKERKMVLDTVRRSRNIELSKLNMLRKDLEQKRVETDKVVAQLKSEGNNLRTVLREKEEQQRRLDRELDKIIAEEQARIERQRKEAERKEQERKRKEAEAKKRTTAQASSPKPVETPAKTPEPATPAPPATSVAAADRALTGSFESNQGKLLFPVAGKYRIVRGFGRQKHPQLAHVETENSGIDIEAISSKQARAVFDGTVSATFKQPGYGTIVMIRHGNYLTIYANLDAISVKNGDKVRTGQTLGTIITDPDEDNRAILHFELRKERTKLNPMLWVR